MSVALVLAGHGSHISPNTAGLVWDYVDTLRSWAVADEITACFWKEQPHFNRVLDTLQSEIVVVVPVFTSIGFFSQRVIPSEMNLSGSITERDGRKIHYTRTLGQHPYLHTIVQQKVENILKTASLSAEDVAVAVIGHGTRRSASTRQTTEAQVQALREATIASEVVSAYLDDEPNIPSIYERTQASHIIAVPFFLAAGSHTTQDVPEALRIQYGDFPAQVEDRWVYYTDPIGADKAMCELILELARETGLHFEHKPNANHWSNFPLAGASTLIDALLANEALQFGELLLRKDSVAPLLSTRELCFDTPGQLRKHIRENPFRPLATRSDLKRDWSVQVNSIAEIPTVVETIYPGAMSEWGKYKTCSLASETLENVVARQQGIFAKLDSSDDTKIANGVRSVCEKCIKDPLWYEHLTRENLVPCASPCNYWLSTLMEANNQ